MTVLKRVDKAIDAKLAAEPAALTQIISKETAHIRQITRRQSASPVKEIRLTPTDSFNNLFLRVLFT